MKPLIAKHGTDQFLPVTTISRKHDKEGMPPDAVVLRVKDDNRNVSPRKYKMNSPVSAASRQAKSRPARRTEAKTSLERRTMRRVQLHFEQL